jgi:hypothetical protein
MRGPGQAGSKENALEEKQPQPNPEDPPPIRIFGLALTSLQTFSPDLEAIRETLRALQAKGLDPREAYLHLTETRPKDWPPLPSYEELMGPVEE